MKKLRKMVICGGLDLPESATNSTNQVSTRLAHALHRTHGRRRDAARVGRFFSQVGEVARDLGVVDTTDDHAG